MKTKFYNNRAKDKQKSVKGNLSYGQGSASQSTLHTLKQTSMIFDPYGYQEKKNSRPVSASQLDSFNHQQRQLKNITNTKQYNFPVSSKNLNQSSQNYFQLPKKQQSSNDLGYLGSFKSINNQPEQKQSSENNEQITIQSNSALINTFNQQKTLNILDNSNNGEQLQFGSEINLDDQYKQSYSDQNHILKTDMSSTKMKKKNKNSNYYTMNNKGMQRVQSANVRNNNYNTTTNYNNNFQQQLQILELQRNKSDSQNLGEYAAAEQFIQQLETLENEKESQQQQLQQQFQQQQEQGQQQNDSEQQIEQNFQEGGEIDLQQFNVSMDEEEIKQKNKPGSEDRNIKPTYYAGEKPTYYIDNNEIQSVKEFFYFYDILVSSKQAEKKAQEKIQLKSKQKFIRNMKFQQENNYYKMKANNGQDDNFSQGQRENQHGFSYIEEDQEYTNSITDRMSHMNTQRMRLQEQENKYTMKQADIFLEKTYMQKKNYSQMKKNSTRENIINTIFHNSKILDHTLSQVFEKQKRNWIYVPDREDNKMDGVKLVTMNKSKAYLNINTLRNGHTIYDFSKSKDPFRKILNIDKKCTEQIRKINFQLKQGLNLRFKNQKKKP